MAMTLTYVIKLSLRSHFIVNCTHNDDEEGQQGCEMHVQHLVGFFFDSEGALVRYLIYCWHIQIIEAQALELELEELEAAVLLLFGEGDCLRTGETDGEACLRTGEMEAERDLFACLSLETDLSFL